MGRVVTHIVPYFAPTLDGVGDYARILGRHLREHGWESRFIICDLTWAGPEKIEDFALKKISECRSKALGDALRGSEKILLHYVGYGYQRRGVPLWLARGILSGPRRMVTVFHEIWSKGSPRRSVFYLAWLQKLLVRQLLCASRRSFASTYTNVAKLDRMRGGATEWLPIPSNLPVPSELIWRERTEAGWIPILFGRMDARCRTLRYQERLIRGLQQRGLLKEILVAGKDVSAFPGPSEDVAALARMVPQAKIRAVGEIDDTMMFGEADVYLSSHRGADGCKSGALMAALSAGCPAILGDNSDPAPLRDGGEIFLCDGSEAAIDALIAKRNRGEFSRVGAAGRDWFLKNANWPIISGKIAAALAVE